MHAFSLYEIMQNLHYKTHSIFSADVRVHMCLSFLEHKLNRYLHI